MRRKITGLLLSVLLVLVLAGCGAQVEGELTLDKSMSGKRTVAVTFEKSHLKALPDGIESIDKAVADSNMSWLTYKSEEKNDTYLLSMEFAFANQEEYTERCSKLVEREVVITFEPAEGTFSQGYLLKEDFSTSDLVNWLKTAMIEKYPNQKSAIEQLEFSSGPTNVIYEGRTTVGGSGTLSIDKRQNFYANALSLETVVESNGTYTRTVELGFDKGTQDTMGSELMAAVEGLMPEDAEYTSMPAALGVTYTVVFSADTLETLGAKTNQILKVEATPPSLQIEGEVPFSRTVHIAEQIDTTGLLPADFKNDIPYRWVTDSTLLLEEASIRLKSEDGNDQNQNKALSRENGGYSLSLKPGVTDLTLLGERAYELRRLDIHTKWDKKNVSRTLGFCVAADVSRAIGQELTTYLQNRLPEGAVLDEPFRDSSGLWIYAVDFSGTLEEMSTFMADFTGSADNRAEVVNNGRKGMWTRKSLWREQVDVSRLLKSAVVVDGVSYTMDLPMGYSLENSLLNDVPSEDTEKGALKTPQLAFSAKVEASYWDFFIIFGACICGLLLIILLAVVIRYNVQKRRREAMNRPPLEAQVLDAYGRPLTALNAPGEPESLVPPPPVWGDVEDPLPMAGNIPTAPPRSGLGMTPGFTEEGPPVLFDNGQAIGPQLSNPAGPPEYFIAGQANMGIGAQTVNPAPQQRAPAHGPKTSGIGGGVARVCMSVFPRVIQLVFLVTVAAWLLPFVSFTVNVPKEATLLEQVLGEENVSWMQSITQSVTNQSGLTNLLLGGALGDDALTFSGLELMKGSSFDQPMAVAAGETSMGLAPVPLMWVVAGICVISFVLSLFWSNHHKPKWIFLLCVTAIAIGILFYFRIGLEAGTLIPLGAKLEFRLWMGYPLLLLLLGVIALFSALLIWVSGYARKHEREKWRKIIDKEDNRQNARV